MIQSPGVPMAILAFLCAIGPLVFIHEMGHYLAGRLFCVKAEAFSIGFGREMREGEDEEAIKRMFTPEFRNRLDATIAFAGLSPVIIQQVVAKFIKQLEAQLADRKVRVELSPEASAWIAEKGYDKLYGARPLARFIQEHLKKPLADELLFGKLTRGGMVTVKLADDKLVFDIIDLRPPSSGKKGKGGSGPSGSGGPKGPKSPKKIPELVH